MSDMKEFRTILKVSSRYRPLNIEKPQGDQADFWGEKFEYTSKTSFEGALRAESKDTEST